MFTFLTSRRASTSAGAAPATPARRGFPVARRYHVHAALVTYCLVALLMSIGAFNSNNNLLFWLFFLSLSLILVSGFLSGAMLMAVRVERLPIADTDAGGVLAVRYRVTNAGRWAPLFAATISEIAPEPEPAPVPDTLHAHAHGRLARLPVAFAPHAAAGSSIEIDAPVRLHARGLIHLSDFTLSSAFPFGIVSKSVRFRQNQSIVIRPKPVRFELDEHLAQSRRGSTADQDDRLAGAGEHFFALREYQPGDTPRSIAWRASARLAAASSAGPTGADESRLLVRQTTAPRPRRITLLLDLHDAPGERAYEHAISRAAGAVLAASRRGILLGLAVRGQFDPSPRALAEPRTGHGHVSRLLNELGLLPNFIEPTSRPASQTTHRATPHALRPQLLVISARQAPPDSTPDVAADRESGGGDAP
ncbi:MAG: DUF58 domain-containing protein [Phycisphaerales bacterium]